MHSMLNVRRTICKRSVLHCRSTRSMARCNAALAHDGCTCPGHGQPEIVRGEAHKEGAARWTNGPSLGRKRPRWATTQAGKPGHAANLDMGLFVVQCNGAPARKMRFPQHMWHHQSATHGLGSRLASCERSSVYSSVYGTRHAQPVNKPGDGAVTRAHAAESPAISTSPTSLPTFPARPFFLISATALAVKNKSGYVASIP